MKVCIPVNEDRGLDSPVCGHFGSAPLFMVVDTESGACRGLPNANQHHAHGMCRPLDAIGSEPLDALVVGGIGLGALTRLRESGLEVWISDRADVKSTLAALADGSLRRADPAGACAHHGQGQGHGHQHGAGHAHGGPHGCGHGEHGHGHGSGCGKTEDKA
ncbi:MAG: NifB/NifX family molybdenum-iron cluster-binding protein [Candidatus Krumholzibacteriia bacterium]